MIYLVTNQKELYSRPHNSGIMLASIEEAYSYLDKLTYIGLDTETMGFDAHTKELICIQLGDYNNQYIIDAQSVHWRPVLKKLYQDKNKTILMHNAAFDLRFTFPFIPENLYDTFLAEACLNRGDKLVRKSLDAVTNRYLKIQLDKTIRGSIHREGLSDRVIRYAADDIKYLEIIMDKQKAIAKQRELTDYIRLENKFVIPLTYAAHSGIYLSREKWEAKSNEDDLKLKECVQKLDQYIIENYPDSKFVNNQLDFFNENLSTNIVWSSSQQVTKVFEFLGMDLTVVEKGKSKKSVDQKHIAKLAQDNPIVELYIAYSKQAKLVSTYGHNFIKFINKKTNRVHTVFNQIMDTGRISSGKRGTKKWDDDYPNLQNIPADDRHRHCFIPQSKDNIFVVADYSGQEQIILANKSLEPNLLEFYRRPGKNDMHSYVAKLCFPEQLKDVPEHEVKEKNPELRYLAKTAGFSINYGGVGMTISRNAGVSLEVGNSVYESYFKAFPQLKEYFKKVIKETLDNGYILINEITKSKTFVSRYNEYLTLKEKIYSGGAEYFWESYRKEKELNSQYFQQQLKPMVREFFMLKGDIERNALNYPVQGTAAEMTKLAAIFFFSWLKEKELLGIVLIVNIVHDEIVVECPKNISEEVAKNLKECMEKAGNLFCTTIPIKAEPKITDKWEH